MFLTFQRGAHINVPLTFARILKLMVALRTVSLRNNPQPWQVHPCQTGTKPDFEVR